jgi:hypothetical protein
MTLLRKPLAVLVSYFMIACLLPLDVMAEDAQQQAAQSSAPQAPTASDQNSNLPPEDNYAPLTAAELDGVVAPIALYPDALVAQVLGAASFPDQVTDAAFWIRDNSSLTGDALAKAVDEQDWDPSVKALTQFPSVLDTLARNLAWTSTLGEAAAMQQSDVMAAVQRMRAKAYESGNLKSSSEIKVVQQAPQTIVIQPANPQVVYVPAYNPTVIYGAPVVVPNYTYVAPPGIVATAAISFGAGIAIGAMFNGCNSWTWGWGCWGTNWGGNTIIYNRNVYYGNPYWRGGYYRPYRPGYPSYGRPPYYRPPGRPVNGRPPYNRPPNRPVRPPYNPGKPNPGRPGGGKPPTIQPLPSPGKPGGGRPPGGGQPGKPGTGQPGRPGGGQPGGGQPGGGQPGRPGGQPGTRPGQPSIQPVPNPGKPGGTPGTRPAPTTRPAPAAPKPSAKPARGYPQQPKPATIKPAPAKSGAFSSGGRPASTRGNTSLNSSRAASNNGGGRGGKKP